MDCLQSWDKPIPLKKQKMKMAYPLAVFPMWFRKMVEEVRRQFREIPGILAGKATPDYAKCVEISTKGAQKEMLFPSITCTILTCKLLYKKHHSVAVHDLQLVDSTNIKE